MALKLKSETKRDRDRVSLAWTTMVAMMWSTEQCIPMIVMAAGQVLGQIRSTIARWRIENGLWKSIRKKRNVSRRLDEDIF